MRNAANPRAARTVVAARALLAPVRPRVAPLDGVHEAVHQLAPGRVAHRAILAGALPAAVREPQLAAAVLALDRPGESGALPLRMIAGAVPDDALARLQRLDRHAEDDPTLREAELGLAADALL